MKPTPALEKLFDTAPGGEELRTGYYAAPEFIQELANFIVTGPRGEVEQLMEYIEQQRQKGSDAHAET